METLEDKGVHLSPTMMTNIKEHEEHMLPSNRGGASHRPTRVMRYPIS
uniref:Uncharacterized protein n=1 Tax=Arundo donax TaxID=35708 RepID=A0A0A9GQ02_ARUDO